MFPGAVEDGGLPSVSSCVGDFRFSLNRLKHALSGRHDHVHMEKLQSMRAMLGTLHAAALSSSWVAPTMAADFDRGMQLLVDLERIQSGASESFPEEEEEVGYPGGYGSHSGYGYNSGGYRPGGSLGSRGLAGGTHMTDALLQAQHSLAMLVLHYCGQLQEQLTKCKAELSTQSDLAQHSANELAMLAAEKGELLRTKNELEATVKQLLQVLELLQTQLYGEGGEGGGGAGGSEGGSEGGSRGGSRATSPSRRASACGSSGGGAGTFARASTRQLDDPDHLLASLPAAAAAVVGPSPTPRTLQVLKGIHAKASAVGAGSNLSAPNTARLVAVSWSGAAGMAGGGPAKSARGSGSGVGEDGGVESERAGAVSGVLGGEEGVEGEPAHADEPEQGATVMKGSEGSAGGASMGGEGGVQAGEEVEEEEEEDLVGDSQGGAGGALVPSTTPTQDAPKPLGRPPTVPPLSLKSLAAAPTQASGRAPPVTPPPLPPPPSVPSLILRSASLPLGPHTDRGQGAAPTPASTSTPTPLLTAREGAGVGAAGGPSGAQTARRETPRAGAQRPSHTAAAAAAAAAYTARKGGASGGGYGFGQGGGRRDAGTCTEVRETVEAATDPVQAVEGAPAQAAQTAQLPSLLSAQATITTVDASTETMETTDRGDAVIQDQQGDSRGEDTGLVEAATAAASPTPAASDAAPTPDTHTSTAPSPTSTPAATPRAASSLFPHPSLPQEPPTSHTPASPPLPTTPPQSPPPSLAGVRPWTLFGSLAARKLAAMAPAASAEEGGSSPSWGVRGGGEKELQQAVVGRAGGNGWEALRALLEGVVEFDRGAAQVVEGSLRVLRGAWSLSFAVLGVVAALVLPAPNEGSPIM